MNFWKKSGKKFRKNRFVCRIRIIINKTFQGSFLEFGFRSVNVHAIRLNVLKGLSHEN